MYIAWIYWTEGQFTALCCVRFHHTTQEGLPFKTLALKISRYTKVDHR